MATLPAGYDFLGKLGNDLRDLSGLDTLIYELIQNADDPVTATEMRFEVGDAGLVLWNDGVFTDCGHQESRGCLGVSDNGSTSVRCDFHSFRLISGQAKREKAGTIGAFGIGFTSVFQVCDYPELISAGRHWILRYDERESDRVGVCAGCDRDHSAAGTTFVLPWARNPKSSMRVGLHVSAVDPDIAESFVSELLRTIPQAMVFLNRLKQITVSRNGTETASFTRVDHAPWRYIEKGGTDEDLTLYVLSGEFEEVAEELRSHHPSMLGHDVRQASIGIAIPLGSPAERLPLHAVLPTRQTSALRFRLSSSFYPFQDRKRLKFEAEGDPESEWNRAAVRGAAVMLASALGTLPRELGHEELWALIKSTHTVHRDLADAPDAAFSCFWLELCEQIPVHDVVWTTQEQWTKPAGALLIERAWEPAIDSLHALEVAVVHPGIRDFVRPVAKEIGVRQLDAESLAGSIAAAGLTDPRSSDALPDALGTVDGLNGLLRIIGDLVAAFDFEEALRVDAFDGCAVIPCLDQMIVPPELVVSADPISIELFRALPSLTFVDLARIDDVAPQLKQLIDPLVAGNVVDALIESHNNGDLNSDLGDVDIASVLRWFAGRREELCERDIKNLRSLPIFPSANGPQALDALSLPGPFVADPLDISDTVDLREIQDLRGFIGEGCLGAETLDLDVYVHEWLVPALTDERHTFEESALDRLLNVLAGQVDNLDQEARSALSALPLIPTAGGSRLPASRAYFDSDVVRSVLGSSVVASAKGHSYWSALFEALGASREPRPQDLVAAVAAIVAQDKTRERVEQIRTIIEHLGPKFRFGSDEQRDRKRETLEKDYADLLQLQWLPISSREAWGAPDELYRTEWRTAFATTGDFLELPEKTVQQPNADLLELLGVQFRPSPRLVIEHLQHLVERKEPVAKRVYDALDQFASAADLAPLLEQRCVLVARKPSVEYALPVEVVTAPGQLAGYIHALPSDLANHGNLTAALGIDDVPGARHAIHVLRLVAPDPGERRVASESEIGAVQSSWRIIERAREECDTGEDLADFDELVVDNLSDLACWPDGAGALREPRDLFIDDMPALKRSLRDAAILELLINRPRWGIGALSAAGLRFLSDALHQTLLLVPNPRPHAVLSKLLRVRQDALARVLSSEDVDVGALERLDGLQFLEVDEIHVHRTIGEPPLDLGEHSVAAFFDGAGNRLFASPLGKHGWTEIAVEIARVLCGAGFSPGIASNISNVLSASSDSAAHSALDALHIPRLSLDFESPISEDEDTVPLFDDEDEVDDADEHDDFIHNADEQDDPLETAAVDDDAERPDHEVEGAEHLPEDVLEGEGGGTDVAGPGLAGGGGGATPTSGSGTTSGGGGGAGGGTSGGGSGIRGGGTKGRKAGSKGGSDIGISETPWRVWVSGTPGERQDRLEESAAATEVRAEISRRGVELVLRYEEEHGRWAQEMPPNNPGYDIESRGEPGRPPTRLIEVKALAGSWQAEWGVGRPPQLTSEQFRMSTEEGKHWLYVVERALDKAGYAIYPIQAVGQRANRYFFDHGWKGAADRPAGPGLESGAPHTIEHPPVPDVSTVLFPTADRQDGDVPFFDWSRVQFATKPGAADHCDRWFTSPELVEAGDFAVQQFEQAMGLTVPFGAVAVFRPATAPVVEGSVVIADVANTGADPRFLIRRVHTIRDEQGEVELLQLRVDVPGPDDEFEFDEPYSIGRVVATLIGHQKLEP